MNKLLLKKSCHNFKSQICSKISITKKTIKMTLLLLINKFNTLFNKSNIFQIKKILKLKIYFNLLLNIILIIIIKFIVQINIHKLFKMKINGILFEILKILKIKILIF